VYLHTHSDLKHLVKLANDHKLLVMAFNKWENKYSFSDFKNQYQKLYISQGFFGFFEFFSNNHLNFFSKKFNRLKHRLPLDTKPFSNFRKFDDIR